MCTCNHRLGTVVSLALAFTTAAQQPSSPTYHLEASSITAGGGIGDSTNLTLIHGNVYGYSPGTIASNSYILATGLAAQVAARRFGTLVLEDDIGPTVSDLAPARGSVLTATQPTVRASYLDNLYGTGVDLDSVKLTFQGVDVTGSAERTRGGLEYTPPGSLPTDLYECVLDVADRAGNRTRTSWSFRVDVDPPVIVRIDPPTGVWVPTARPTIGASISDGANGSGINKARVTLSVNNLRVSPTITDTTVAYRPTVPLASGQEHTATLRLEDNAGHVVIQTWRFGVE
jgi:hypothetical protein